jgi:hypothetical protein
MFSAPIWFFLLALALPQGSEQPGIKITTQSGPPGYSSARTSYIQSDRLRMEYRNSFGLRHPAQPIYGPRLARIVRCDLGQVFELNLDTAEYTSAPYPPKPRAVEETKARDLENLTQPRSAPPTVRVEIRTDDTGERKEMFGHAARHILTTKSQVPLEGSHSEPQQTVTDGWYIDFDQRLSCDPKPTKGTHGYIGGYLSTGDGKRPVEKPEFVYVGEPETGVPLDVTMTSKSSSTLPGAFVSRFETRVTEFVEAPLDQALFEIPPGFKLVDRIERNPPASAFPTKP